MENTENKNLTLEEGKKEELGDTLGETSAPVELNSNPSPLTQEEQSDTVIEEEGTTEPAQDVPAQDTIREDENSFETPATKTFTQEEVNDIVGKIRVNTREKTFKYIYDRYGVGSEEELDEMVGSAQRLDTFREKYDADKSDWTRQLQERDTQLSDIKEKVALMESGIDSARYEDAKLILRGKGLEVTLENINNELTTHPEWKKEEVPAQENKNYAKIGSNEAISKISVLGNDTERKDSGEDEKSYTLNKLFKL